MRRDPDRCAICRRHLIGDAKASGCHQEHSGYMHVTPSNAAPARRPSER